MSLREDREPDHAWGEKRTKPAISDVIAEPRRERFKLIRGGRQDPLIKRMNTLATELAGLKPEDPRRTEIITELSRLKLLSAATQERPGMAKYIGRNCPRCGITLASR